MTQVEENVAWATQPPYSGVVIPNECEESQNMHIDFSLRSK